ncbi:HD domain-containing protein [Microvirga zambiensis]|uniref:HD domain-containing protein n=1 Tax=Microvirga zambiensis TaxID=1402137 RepID=UPI00191E423B|nr:HD domain-containing protein [Microvirga zambiensis]
MSSLERAIAIAAEAHMGQTDKGGSPYILHPLRVMMTARQDGGDDAAIVAVLHDVIEDCPDWPAERLASEGSSPEIMAALDCLTRRQSEDYMEFVARCSQNPIARIVKLADLKDNMDLDRLQSPTPKDLERLERYKQAAACLAIPE